MRVLIVEDEPMLSAELGFIVDGAGHQVVGMAGDLAEALRIAGEEQPDLALVDLHLNDGMTGLKTARRLHEEHGASIVFLTGNPEEVPSVEGVAYGVISKPYYDHAVLRMLEYVQARREGRTDVVAPSALDVRDSR